MAKPIQNQKHKPDQKHSGATARIHSSSSFPQVPPPSPPTECPWSSAASSSVPQYMEQLLLQAVFSRQMCKQRTCKRTGLRFTFILKTEFNKLLENNGEAAPHQRECGKFKEPCIASPPAAYACMQTHTDTQTFTVYSTTQTRQRTPTAANNPADDTAARHIMAQMLCMTYTRKHLSCTHDARARTWRAYTRRTG